LGVISSLMVVVAVSGCTDNTNSVNSDNTTPPTPAPATPATKPATPAATGPTDILPSSKFPEMPIQEAKSAALHVGLSITLLTKLRYSRGNISMTINARIVGMFGQSHSAPR
jgi:hypothetical protein